MVSAVSIDTAARPTPKTPAFSLGLSALLSTNKNFTVGENRDETEESSKVQRRLSNLPKWSPTGKENIEPAKLSKNGEAERKELSLSNDKQQAKEQSIDASNDASQLAAQEPSTASAITNEKHTEKENIGNPATGASQKREDETKGNINGPSTDVPLVLTKFIELAKWSLVIVANNPKITGFDISETEDWVVLVGQRSDTAQLWHSSMITGRLSNKEITTGSGRVYKLNGDLDGTAMVDAGFTFELIEAFKDGFPENWLEILLQSFSSIDGDRRKSKITEKLNKPKEQTRKSSNVSAKKVSLSPRPRPSPNTKRSRRNSDPPSRILWKDEIVSTPIVSLDYPILGRTRSGRRVVKPLPYWENKYQYKDLSSPLQRKTH